MVKYNIEKATIKTKGGFSQSFIFVIVEEKGENDEFCGGM